MIPYFELAFDLFYALSKKEKHWETYAAYEIYVLLPIADNDIIVEETM